MPAINSLGFEVPYREAMVDKASALLTVVWQQFFTLLHLRLAPLGIELSCPLANNVSVAADISGMVFNSTKTNHAVVEYLIQRITTGGGATALYAAGAFHVVYKASAGTWHIVAIGTPGPDSHGITFTITTSGQVQYASTNITGTANVSKITWRARTLAAKVAS